MLKSIVHWDSTSIKSASHLPVLLLLKEKQKMTRWMVTKISQMQKVKANSRISKQRKRRKYSYLWSVHQNYQPVIDRDNNIAFSDSTLPGWTVFNNIVHYQVKPMVFARITYVFIMSVWMTFYTCRCKSDSLPISLSNILFSGTLWNQPWLQLSA